MGRNAVEPWTQERVAKIQQYMEENNRTVNEAAKDLNFSVTSYYHTKKLLKGGPRKYTRRTPGKNMPIEEQAKIQKAIKQEPITLELASPTHSGGGRVVILIADRSQVKSILSEVF